MKNVIITASAVVIAGCSGLTSITDTTNLVDYSNHKSVKILEVPADLDQPVYDKTYVTNVSDNIDEAKAASVSSAVPLVSDEVSTVEKPAAKSNATVSKQGDQVALNLSGDASTQWNKTLAALKAMKMTVQSSDEATGLIKVRDRSEVADQDSFIGSLLNNAIGRVNAGAEYQVMAKAGSVVFKDAKGGALSEKESEGLITRFQKALADL
ncbi:hypothetical protein EOL70_29390 [Leucothrix sargassi]|nr:hypothetical protein EOL70_29390 [Leucothrix sargassi]